MTPHLYRCRFIRKYWIVSVHCFENHMYYPGYWRASAHLAKPKSRIKAGVLCKTRAEAIASLHRECEKWEKRWDKKGYDWRNS